MMRLASVLLATALAASGADATRSQAAGAQPTVRTVIVTGNDQLKFDPAVITAKAGEQLRIVLKNTGTVPKAAMGHNLVVLKAGTDASGLVSAGITARDTDYIPPDQKGQVIAATAMTGPAETAEITFAAPAKTGAYPYVCTFPGHYAAGMKGVLQVK